MDNIMLNILIGLLIFGGVPFIIGCLHYIIFIRDGTFDFIKAWIVGTVLIFVFVTILCLILGIVIICYFAGSLFTGV